jgi:hypothetical protein
VGVALAVAETTMIEAVVPEYEGRFIWTCTWPSLGMIVNVLFF